MKVTSLLVAVQEHFVMEVKRNSSGHGVSNIIRHSSYGNNTVHTVITVCTTILSRRGSESRTRKLHLHYGSFAWGNFNMAD